MVLLLPWELILLLKVSRIVNSNIASDTLPSLVMVIARFILVSLKQFPGGYSINKIEYANHSLKYYWLVLEKLVHDNLSYKGKGNLLKA